MFRWQIRLPANWEANLPDTTVFVFVCGVICPGATHGLSGTVSFITPISWHAVRARLPLVCKGAMPMGHFFSPRAATATAFCALAIAAANNTQAIVTAQAPLSPSRGPLLITALHYHGREGSADEAVRLTNVSTLPVTLDASWSLAAPYGAGQRALSFRGAEIAPGQHMWLARDGAAFKRQFGVSPTLTLADTTGGSVTFANGGGWVRLTHAGQVEPVDTLVYGTGSVISGWIGAPLRPYTVTNLIGADGQILQRRWSIDGRAPLDTDSASDWLNDRSDPLHASAPVYPGWALETLRQPVHASGAVTIALAPDASFDVVSLTLASAQRSIDLQSFTFDHAGLGVLLAERAAAGVRVRVLLDGAPVGGLSDQTRWICEQIHAAGSANGGGCWFMRSLPAQKISSRYRHLHAKFAVIDGAKLVLGSENFGMRGMPDDDKRDGTYGHRGVLAVLTAPPLVARAAEVFAADMGLDAGTLQRDIAAWCSSGCEYGPPPTGFTPVFASGGVSYTVRQPAVSAVSTATATLSTSPESHLVDPNGLLARIAQAGPGDELLVEQLDEPLTWGSATLPADNPRLSALIAAAQRGATVHILLDAGYDRPYEDDSNAATVTALNELDIPTLRAATANPTGAGIHNKMVLMRIGQSYLVHLGSWNGSEVSAKLNREMSVVIDSEPLHAFLRAAFVSDFQRTQHLYLPLILQHYSPPTHLLISELMINPAGIDQTEEWVEVYNPTSNLVSLKGYKVGDLLAPVPGMLGEGMLQFPDQARIASNTAIVIAQDALAFAARHGRKPDYEVGSYDDTVPDMIRLSSWTDGTPSFANDGDEVALLRSDDIIEDVVIWLKGSSPGVTPFSQSIASGQSLQRWPPTGDTNNCAVDFRLQAVPSPGRVP
jgi:cardiolipin synthase A/B